MRIWVNIFALVLGLVCGAAVTWASADTLPGVPCDCAVPVDRQPNGLPK